MRRRVLLLLLLPLVLGAPVLEPHLDLRLGEAEGLRELLPLGADHVVVLLERVLQLQQLRRGERGADPLRLPERVQQEARRLGT